MTNCFIRLSCLNLSSSQEAQHLGCINWWQEPTGECSNHTTKLGDNYLPQEGEDKRKNVAPPISNTFFDIFWPSHLWQITPQFQPLQEASFCSQSSKMGIHCINIKWTWNFEIQNLNLITIKCCSFKYNTEDCSQSDKMYRNAHKIHLKLWNMNLEFNQFKVLQQH